MTPKNDSARVRLFPLCDRDGVLLAALSSTCEESPAARADATLFSWMLGLEAGVDAVGAARAVLAVAALESRDPASMSDYRRALVDGLERFIADSGRVASLSLAATSPTGGTRPRRRWRDRLVGERATSDADRRASKEPERGRGTSDEQRKTRL